MKYILIFFILFFPAVSFSQEAISLEQCLSAAIKNHPRKTDKQLLESISANNIMNINSKWKPSVNLNGQVSYQSDVIDIGGNISIPGIEFPSPQKDQYKLYFDLQQTFYDGGRIKQQKLIQEISTKSDVKKLEAEIENVKSNIIDIYFSIIQLQESANIQSLMMNLLKDKKAIINTGIKNGVMMESDLSLIEIEILEMEQEITMANLQKEALITVLSEKCSIDIDEDVAFVPSELVLKETEINRKEIEYMQNQKELLSATISIKEKNRLPVLYGFGQLGYGNPGLNMLNDQFDTYYYVGAGLKWNLWDWKDTRRDKENLNYRSNLIDNQKLEFEQNIENALTNQRAIINTHKEGIESLEYLLDKRMGIVKTFESQLHEGIIKPIDYLMVVNQEKITRIKLLNENISLQKAIATYNFINGEL